MADKISKIQRSANMARIRSKDMRPELTVRRLVHSMGYRYRLHRSDLPGKPDLVFGPRKKVIFVHGCFWHQHSQSDCVDSHLPKSNSGYWGPKLQRNQARDAKNLDLLEGIGWQALVIWECELKDLESVIQKIKSFL